MQRIALSGGAYMHTYLHKVQRTLEEVIDSSETGGIVDFKASAKQIIDSMEDEHCVWLLEELHDACIDAIKESWAGAPSRMEEDRYKNMKKFNP